MQSETCDRSSFGSDGVQSAICDRPNAVDGISDGIAVGRGRTTVDGYALRTLMPNSQWTNVAASGRRGRCRDYLQNRWSASLAMSTDGSFPSRPRHVLLGQEAVALLFAGVCGGAPVYLNPKASSPPPSLPDGY